MPGEKILIVDDEKPINDLIRSYIESEGFTALSAYTGKEAIECVEKENPDLVILDVMLPDIEGINVCLEVRKTNHVPIIFLSCKAEEIDKIVALSVGGDDYLTKPFHGGELVARVKAQLRRRNQFEGGKQAYNDDSIPEKISYDFPGMSMNIETREVYVDNKPVNLTAKEFDILKLLIENPSRVFNAEQIFEQIWKMEALEGDGRTVMVYISTLRKKIETNPNSPKYIASIRGLGYKLNTRHLL